jgi:Neurochondrin
MFVRSEVHLKSPRLKVDSFGESSASIRNAFAKTFLRSVRGRNQNLSPSLQQDHPTMTDPSKSSVYPGEIPVESNGGLGHSPTMERIKDLLQAKDDTSRFVGLALLKSVLDNGQLGQEPENLQLLWESMSPKFLDRLLRAPQSERINRTESKNMVDLAVAVLHTFTNLLPEESRKQKRLTGRIDPLVKAVVKWYI